MNNLVYKDKITGLQFKARRISAGLYVIIHPETNQEARISKHDLNKTHSYVKSKSKPNLFNLKEVK